MKYNSDFVWKVSKLQPISDEHLWGVQDDTFFFN